MAETRKKEKSGRRPTPDDIVAPAPEPADERAVLERKVFKAWHDARIKSYEQDTELRKTFASRMFNLLIGWLVSVLVIIVFVGAGILTLSDGVLMSLLGVTSVNVIGLVLVILKYLFPRSTSSPD